MTGSAKCGVNLEFATGRNDVTDRVKDLEIRLRQTERRVETLERNR
jgi:hypothetical protein